MYFLVKFYLKDYTTRTILKTPFSLIALGLMIFFSFITLNVVLRKENPKVSERAIPISLEVMCNQKKGGFN